MGCNCWIGRLLLIGLSATFAYRAFAAPAPNNLAAEIERRYSSVRELDVRWTCSTTIKTQIKSYDALLFSGRPRDQYAIKGKLRSRKYTIPLSSKHKGEVEETKFVFDGSATRSQILRHLDDPKKLTLRDNYYIEVSVAGGDEGTPGQMEQTLLYFESLGSPYYNGRLVDPWRRQCVRDDKVFFKTDLDHPFSVVHALRSGRYQVRDAKEALNGRECWVAVARGEDELWIDSQCYVVVKRNWYWRGGHDIMVSYENKDFVNGSDGLCWPKSVTRTWFVDAVRFSDYRPDQIHFVDELTVNHLATDKVEDELFVSKPVLGSTVMNNTIFSRDGKPKFVSYVAGRTPQATERAMQEGLTRAKAGRRTPLWHAPVASARNLFLLANAVLILILITMVVLKRVRKANA